MSTAELTRDVNNQQVIRLFYETPEGSHETTFFTGPRAYERAMLVAEIEYGGCTDWVKGELEEEEDFPVLLEGRPLPTGPRDD